MLSTNREESGDCFGGYRNVRVSEQKKLKSEGKFGEHVFLHCQPTIERTSGSPHIVFGTRAQLRLRFCGAQRRVQERKRTLSCTCTHFFDCCKAGTFAFVWGLFFCWGRPPWSRFEIPVRFRNRVSRVRPPSTTTSSPCRCLTIVRPIRPRLHLTHPCHE
jgi:hypothetical protein